MNLSLSPDDLVLRLLYLWAHRGHPEHPVCAGASQANGRSTLAAPGLALSGLHRHRGLHAVHLADLSAGQQRAAEDVYGEGTLSTPLRGDG